MKTRRWWGLISLVMIPTLAAAAVTTTVSHDTNYQGFAGQLSNGDLIAGLLGAEQIDLGDIGWHPANPAANNSSLPEGLPTFTDGQNNGGLFGLLNDWADPFEPPRDGPVKVVDYELGGTYDLGGINILTGNQLDPDGRVFATFRVLVSTDNGVNFEPISGYTPRDGVNPFGYFESNTPGQTNTDLLPNNNILPAPDRAHATFTQVFDDAGSPLAVDVTDIRFEFFCVHNTLHEYRDPYAGLNPYVSSANEDDGYTAANTSPLVWEIDVLEFSGGPACDFTGDGLCNLADLNSLLDEGPIADGVSTTPGVNDQYDLTGDNIIDNLDVDVWLADAATANGLASPYKRGDANLDGVVDVSDFNLWNGSKFTSSLHWDDGDFSGNGQVDVSDFNVWNGVKFTSSDGVAAVPEPAAGLLSLVALVMLPIGARLGNRPPRGTPAR